MEPRNPLNDLDVDGNTQAWMEELNVDDIFECYECDDSERDVEGI